MMLDHPKTAQIFKEWINLQLILADSDLDYDHAQAIEDYPDQFYITPDEADVAHQWLIRQFIKRLHKSPNKAKQLADQFKQSHGFTIYATPSDSRP